MTLEEALERIEELENELNAGVIEEEREKRIQKLEEENLILRTKLEFYAKGFKQICSFFI